MKLSIITLGLLVFLCFSCKKENNAICPDGLEEGRIIGQDFRKCACCSGWWIEIGTDTLRSFILPKNIDIDGLNLVAPVSIPVCLSYEISEICVMGEELIEIGEMSLQ